VFRRQNNILDKILTIEPDVIVIASHVGNITYWQLMRLRRKLGFRLIAWQCGYEYNPSRLKDLILKKFVTGFDHHLVYHTNAKLYAKRYGAIEDQITVIHNTINEEKIQITPKAEARTQVLAKYPQIRNRKIILFVGAILEEKRLPLVLEALDILRRPDFLFLGIGDGPYLPRFRKRCDVREDVILAGSIFEGVGTYFDAADLFLLPGTGGLAINEAMAHSLPIISGYADGSADDLVLDNYNGYRLRDGTPSELAEKIALVLDDDSAATRMGRSSRKMITSQFSFRHFIERVCGVLETA
jgi:glycosyltransferase involved in cell wall biosynthesis